MSGKTRTIHETIHGPQSHQAIKFFRDLDIRRMPPAVNENSTLAFELITVNVGWILITIKNWIERAAVSFRGPYYKMDYRKGEN